jgi:prepilin-type N-terminal cleavage/methylation domain-containing protein
MTAPKRDGFTLIELLIVIVIMGVLAAVAVSLFWRVKDRGLESSLQSDLKTVATQQEDYFMRHSAYAPSTGSIPDYTGSPGVVVTINYAAADGWAGQATHPGIPNVRCGLIVGTAPAGSADPATSVGIVQCTSE